MKKIKILVPSIAAVGVAAVAIAPLAACNKGSKDTDHMEEPTQSQKEPTIAKGATQATYSFEFKEEVTEDEINVDVDEIVQNNTSNNFSSTKNDEDKPIKVVDWTCSGKKVNTQVEWNDKTTGGSCSFTLVFTSTKGWTNRVSGCKFTFDPIKVESVKLDENELTLKPGATKQLTATVLPEAASEKTVTWKSSDEAIATVSEEGLVTAVAEGSADITVTTNDGEKTAVCAVTVEPEVVKHTVTFMVNGSQYGETIEVVDGQKLAQPEEPAIANKVFWGWCPDEQCQEDYYDFNQPVTTDLILYADFGSNFFNYEAIDSTTCKVTGLKSSYSYLSIRIPARAVINNQTYTITEVAEDAFSCGSYDWLSSLTIAKTVKTIGNYGFNQNAYLPKVVFEEGSQLETIGNSAFRYCGIMSGSLSINLEACTHLKTIGSCAFQSDPLESIKLPGSIEEFAPNAFYGTTSLTSVDLSLFTDPTKIPTVEGTAANPSFVKPSSGNLTFTVANQEMLDAFMANADWATYTEDKGYVWEIK